MQQSLSKQPSGGEATATARDECGGATCGPVSWPLASAIVTMCALALLPIVVGPRQRVAWGRTALHAAQLRLPEEPPDNATVVDFPDIASLAANPDNATLPVSMSPDSATMAICTIMNVAANDPQWVDGQAEDLLEWVKHHRSVGVGRIYIYDHLSEVPLNVTLSEEIASGFVVYEYYTVPADGIVNPMQLTFDACVATYGSRHRHIALIDSDEYLVLMDKRPGAPTTVGQLLDQYYAVRPFGGLVVTWVLFGSSGHGKRPKGGVLRNYWRCLPRWSAQSLQIKTIVNPQHASKSKGSHSWEFKEPYYAVDETFERFDHVFLSPTRATVNRLALFHYVIKSWEDFQFKAKRGGGDGDHKPLDYFNRTDGESICNCTEFAMPGIASSCEDGTHPYKIYQ